MRKNHNIQELIQRYFRDECTPKEVREVISYFQRKGHIADFPGVEDVLEKTGEKPRMDPDSGERIFENVLSIAKEREFQSRKKGGSRNLVWKYAVAAVLIGLLTTTFFLRQTANGSFNQTRANQDHITLQLQDGSVEILEEGKAGTLLDSKGNLLGTQKGNQIIYSPKKQAGELTYNTVQVPYGKKFEILLSDGTHVHLNSGTRLKYPVQFVKGEKRQVFLSGEAFFDVARDKEHPFVVRADDLNVQVLGTQFNVSSYNEDARTDVVLVEGSVSMFPEGETLDSEKSLLLQPGLKGSFDKESGAISQKRVLTTVYTSWIHGELVFRNMTFGNILKKLERHYNLEITNNNEVLAKETFNANFGNEPIEQVLEYLKTMYGITYTLDEDHVIIN